MAQHQVAVSPTAQNREFTQQHIINDDVILTTCFYELTAKEIIWSY